MFEIIENVYKTQKYQISFLRGMFARDKIQSTQGLSTPFY